MTSEQKVVSVYPHARCLTRSGEGWGVFFHGGPRFLGIHSGWAGPDAYGNTKSNAWVNAAKKLSKENEHAPLQN